MSDRVSLRQVVALMAYAGDDGLAASCCSKSALWGYGPLAERIARFLLNE